MWIFQYNFFCIKLTGQDRGQTQTYHRVKNKKYDQNDRTNSIKQASTCLYNVKPKLHKTNMLETKHCVRHLISLNIKQKKNWVVLLLLTDENSCKSCQRPRANPIIWPEVVKPAAGKVGGRSFVELMC